MATALLDAQALRVQRRREALELELSLLGDVPALPEPTAEGSVIRFRKYDQKYWFAAIKIGSRWYVTQDGSRSARQGRPPLTWTELRDWIGERNYNTVEVLA